MKQIVCGIACLMFASAVWAAETPPLPALPPFDHPNSYAAVVEATHARFVDKRWKEHVTQLSVACLEAIARQVKAPGDAVLDNLMAKKTVALALAQFEVIFKLGGAEFKQWAADNPAFAERLFTEPESLENFLNSLLPGDSFKDALQVWGALDAKATNPKNRAHYENLAIALALIHDNPDGISHANAYYDYYVEADAKHKVYIKFEEVLPDELVWGVAPSRFPLDNHTWALGKLKLGWDQLGGAYGMVPYRLNHSSYPEYTMPVILSMGGVCQQQSEFSASNARAHAVPAAGLSGTGTRGGHAWLAFKTPKGWTSGTGRYSDGYSCGGTRHPQTGKGVREWDLFLYDDPDRLNGNRVASKRLLRTAEFAKKYKAEGSFRLLERAARLCKNDPYPWEVWMTALLEDKAPRSTDFWEKLVAEYRKLMRAHPDHLGIAIQIEDEKIFPNKTLDEVGAILKEQRKDFAADRKQRHRFDIIIASCRREAAFYRKREDVNRETTLYKHALHDYGGLLHIFTEIVRDVENFVEEHPEARSALFTAMESIFNKQVDSDGGGDCFRLGMEAQVCNTLANAFGKEGDEKKAKRYKTRHEEISAAAAAKRSAM